jgi:hypothetical protein
MTCVHVAVVKNTKIVVEDLNKVSEIKYTSILTSYLLKMPNIGE